jgi:hypothetical protein
MKNLIGKVLYFDEANFNANLLRYQPVITAFEKVKCLYEALDPSYKFITATLLLFLKDPKSIFDAYKALAGEQLKAAKLSAKALVVAVENEVSNNINELDEALKKVHEIAQKEANSVIGKSFLINPEFLIEQKGKIILDPSKVELIRKLYEEKVETELQNQLQNLLIELKEKYTALRDFANANTILIPIDPIIGRVNDINTNDLLVIHNNGEMEINPKALGYLKNAS